MMGGHSAHWMCSGRFLHEDRCQGAYITRPNGYVSDAELCQVVSMCAWQPPSAREVG